MWRTGILSLVEECDVSEYIKLFKKAMRNPDLLMTILENKDRCLSLSKNEAKKDPVRRTIIPYIYSLGVIFSIITELRRKHENYFIVKELADMYRPPLL